MLRNILRVGCSRFRSRRCFQALVAVALVVSIGLETLPGGFVESATDLVGGRGERTASLTTLQVCDLGDPLLGVQFDLPLLLPGAPSLPPTTELRRRPPDAAAPVPDGFHPAVDHPPQLSA